MTPDFQLPSPVQKVTHPVCENAGVELLIKRDDLIHAAVSGNKWRKLRYNLEKAKQQGKDTLLTFGGAWSNHLAATAAAGRWLGFKTIGVVRGEAPTDSNPTLDFCREQGMLLHHVSRTEYAEKTERSYRYELESRFGSFFLIPEGGANHYGVSGCSEILREVSEGYDVVALACGTGTTLAGIVLSLPTGASAMGFSALKGGDFLREEVMRGVESVLLDKEVAREYDASFTIETAFHFGGYAKHTPELASFLQDFNQRTGIRLDHVYTGKAMFGLLERIKSGHFSTGTRILFIHTGGLQGSQQFWDAL